MLNKLMGAHYGDRSFDVFDWLPLVAILIASGLILAGLFPNGFNSFGFTNGSIVRNISVFFSFSLNLAKLTVKRILPMFYKLNILL